MPLKSIVCVGAIALLSAPLPVLAQAATTISGVSGAPIELLPDVVQTAEQRVDVVVTYTFPAEQGETYLIEVDQHGLDFIVTVTAPAGTGRRYNTPLKRDERELVLLENSDAGAYRISVVSNELTDARGRYSIRVQKVPVAGTDTSYVAALRKMSQAAEANAAGTRARAQQALAAYEEAAELWERTGDIRNQAQALYSVAMLEYWIEYDWARSAELSAAAAGLFARLDQSTLRGNAILLQAMALIEAITEQGADVASSQFDQALTLLRASYGLVEPAADPYELARREYFIGLAYNNVGELDEAQQAWERAAPLFSEAHEWLELLNVQFNIAVAAIQEGRNGRAIETLEAIVAEPRHSADLHFRASVLDNLAAAHRRLGNIDEALRMYTAALEVHREVEDHHGEANSLNGMADTYFAAGELTLAFEYAQQAREVADSAGQGRISAASRTTLGNVAFLSADYESALGFHQTALRTTSSRLLQSQRHVLVAKDLVAMGQYGEAREHGAAALELATAAASPLAIADARQQLGLNSLAVGNIEDAAASFHEALRLYSSLGLRGAEADAHHGLALAARARGAWDVAIEHGELSLSHIEALREKVSAPELRALVGGARRGYYETQIELLMARHAQSTEGSDDFVAAALTVSERARARLTIDLLTEASVDVYRGIDPTLAERKRRLSDELAERRFRQDLLLNSDSFAAQGDELGTLLQEMASIENALNLLETELRSSNPRYASLAASNTLTAREIQGLLDSDSALLQYSLGDTRSFVWVVTRDSIRAVELADRTTIEVVARRAYESLKTLPGAASRSVALRDLARQVIDPVVESLADKRVLVVADGALQYIPFSVLPVQAGGALEPLLAAHEVVNLPSLSVLAMERAGRESRANRKTLIIFADPIFEDTDQRLARSGITPTAFHSDQPRSFGASVPDWCADCILRGLEGRDLARLAATGVEATAIAELVPSQSRLVQTGFDASRANVLAQELGEYRIVHFATHGLVDSEYPALSALALSRFDRSGQPQDGFLRLGDIYALDLNADLVVLSACETALGEAIRGEGLIGLTQGFMYAGAKGLVASLWQVPDGATAALMIRFYGYMLRDGQRPAEALRNAQLSLAAERRWSDPFFWGAFTILGDWQ